MGLPLTVNVQDFFRPQWSAASASNPVQQLMGSLVSHFTIASDGREYLRIKSVKLDEGQQEGYEVESARKEWDTNTVGLHECSRSELMIRLSHPLSLFRAFSKCAKRPPVSYIFYLNRPGADVQTQTPQRSYA